MAGETTPAQPQANPGAEQPAHHSERQPRAQGQFAGAPRPADQHQAVQQAKQMFRLQYKAEGREFDEELDEDTIKQRMAMAKGFYSKSEELARTKKELETERQQRSAAFGDPKAFKAMVVAEMERTGATKQEATARVKDLLTDTLHGFLKEEAEDPRDRELRELREKEQERERQTKEAQSQEELAASKERIRAKGEQLYSTLKEALLAAQKGGLPVDETTLRLMGQHYLRNARHNIGCTPQELVALYEEDLDRDVGARTASLTYAQAKARYPKLVRAIHKGLMEEAQAQRPGKKPAAAPARPQGLQMEERRGPQRPPSYSGSDPRTWQKLQER